MTVASINYTGRKRIKRNQFSFTKKTSSGVDEKTDFTLELTKGLLHHIGDADVIVLDVVSQADHLRFELTKQEKQNIPIDLGSFRSKPRFRLSIVGMGLGEKGSLKSSSEEFRLTSGKKRRVRGKKTGAAVTETEMVSESFFFPKESDDLGELPWKVDCTDAGEVTVLINSRLMSLFDNDSNNAVLRAMMFPPMVKSIFDGIFLHAESVEDLEGSESEKWFNWASYLMEEDCPKQEFLSNGSLSEGWHEWLDTLMDVFCSHGSENDASLLNNMERDFND